MVKEIILLYFPKNNAVCKKKKKFLGTSFEFVKEVKIFIKGKCNLINVFYVYTVGS